MTKQKLSFLLAIPLFAGLLLLPLKPVASVTFQPKGSPQQTAGGASRGICSLSRETSSGTTMPQLPVSALIPATDAELTASAHPSVFVRIPESQSLNAEFTLWDENSNSIYQTDFRLQGTPGIVGFKVPNTVQPMAIGKRYMWSVAVICDPDNRQRDIVVKGRLQRAEISSSLSTQLQGVNDLEKAKLYAQNGFWYDTVATLAELKQLQPTDPRITAQWQELLQSVGLGELSQTPVLNCCQAATL